MPEVDQYLPIILFDDHLKGVFPLALPQSPHVAATAWCFLFALCRYTDGLFSSPLFYSQWCAPIRTQQHRLQTYIFINLFLDPGELQWLITIFRSRGIPSGKCSIDVRMTHPSMCLHHPKLHTDRSSFEVWSIHPRSPNFWLSWAPQVQFAGFIIVDIFLQVTNKC